MKTLKKIFSIFNLLLFTGSFCFTSLSSLASVQNPQIPGHLQKQFVSKHSAEDNACSQFVLEKNENENENESETDQQAQALLLPFFVSFLQLDLSGPSLASAKPLSVRYTNPIYISVCNFRV